MTDHIDGPRVTADPSIDITDLYAFTSPQTPSKVVMAACFFPFSGEQSLFSNAASYKFLISPIKQTGIGDKAGFEAIGEYKTFTFQFEVLPAGKVTGAKAPQQLGKCIFPNGEIIPVEVGNENGSKNADNSIRVFAGLRSDPFILGIQLSNLEPVPNILEDDNVLGIVVEFEIHKIFPDYRNSLFGVIAETSPRIPDPPNSSVKLNRYDWVGRPEQTNYILNGKPDDIDVRDLWNQQAPFKPLAPETATVFEETMRSALKFWDMRDDVQNWSDKQLEAHSKIRLHDFLLIDPSKPTSDQSHLEIEKMALSGLPHKTGGGRTLNSNVIEILVTFLVNRDQGRYYKGGASQATKPGLNTFPYLAAPNITSLSIQGRADLNASTKDVWKLVGNFGGAWHPMIAQVKLVGTGIGQLRQLETLDGNTIIERLTELDDSRHILKYSLISGIPATNYQGIMAVSDTPFGCTVSWTVSYRPLGQGDLIVRSIIKNIINSGLEAIKAKFGAYAK